MSHFARRFLTLSGAVCLMFAAQSRWRSASEFRCKERTAPVVPADTTSWSKAQCRLGLFLTGP
jgi:hypothetical protein